MAKTPRKRQNPQDMKMEMTPMIDCVFLLMIFFVLVIDLSQQDLEDLILPAAKHAQPDDKPPELRPIINIMQNGAVMYRGKPQYIPKVHIEDYSPMEKILTAWKDDPRMKLQGKQQKIGRRDIFVCDDPVLIRADKWTEWHYVGKFMMACTTAPKVAFWKLELAMSEKDKEDKMFKMAGQ